MPAPRWTLITWTLLGALGCAGVALAQQPARWNSPRSPALGTSGRALAPNLVVPQSRAYHPAARAGVHPGGFEPVRITAVRVSVSVLQQVATTTMDIDLRNTAPRQQEAELLVPVPAGAVVRGFDFQGRASEPTAELLPKAEARRIYDQIVARVRDPALLEFVGQALIRSSVFPVPASGTQRVRLTYEQLLPADGPRVDYVLPRSEALDYRVPWTIHVELRSTRPVATVYSPSHEIVTRTSRGAISVEVENLASGPGPFRLSWLMGQKDLSASLFAYPDPRVGGGYFLLLAGLPVEEQAADRPAIRRELTLVLDRSGSMSGGKLDQVRAAAMQVLSGLDEGEWFNLIVYNEGVDPFSERPVAKSAESLGRARTWLASIQPRGGTNIHDALLEALRPAPRPGALPIVLFLTDGLPTIGQTSEKAIRHMVETANRAGRRIFTFGVGVDVNTPLLEKIASETRAFASFVLPGEDVEVKVARVFDSLAGPVLADPVLAIRDPGGRAARGRVRELMPARLPDLFQGDQLVLLGQYTGGGELSFELSGNYLGKKRTFRSKVSLDRATTRNSFVPRLWASRKIAVLVDQIRASGADVDRLPFEHRRGRIDPRFAELVEEIVRLSREFGVLTEYTAFLAREGTDLGGPERVMATAARNFEQRAIRTRSGLSSVNQEYNRQAQASQQVLNPTNAYWDQNMNRVSVSTVQQVNDRAFFRRAGRWVDSRLVDRPAAAPSEIEFGSQAFWTLLDRLAREGRQGTLSLKGDILLEVDGRPVLIRQVATP